MNLSQLLEQWRSSPAFMRNVTHWRTVEGTEGRYADFPPSLSPMITNALRKRNIHRLYTHQREAVDAVREGKDVCIVTPTASGKTFCYNLPILNTVIGNPDTRALYIFPTKALAADQVAELYSLIEDCGSPDVKAFTYDGDTPGAARSAIRSAGHVVVTNPDMLHAAILPNHTKWVKLFENLKYVVIDEIHAYRGVFGSNFANVLRRLERVCEFYGAKPQFICCSATIANPGELASRLTGRGEFHMVDQSGAPSGDKHVIFINPPVVNKQLGIRESNVFVARDIARKLVANEVRSIVFARSRLMVELLATYLKKLVTDELGNDDKVRAYRGGYLPTLRREIERGLRSGDITAVVSTNALELGIDIGHLEACVLCGYPGTIASTWQMAGRAGRRNGASVTILVASSSPLDQFIINHPSYFFGQSPETALIHPHNIYILMNHVKCAAYELPFAADEPYAADPATAQMLEYLSEESLLRRAGNQYHWSADSFPASNVSLRRAADENFLIVDITTASQHRIIGEMDRFTVPMLLHEQAIYLHEGEQYQVEKLDFDDHKAFVRQVNVDYYTDSDYNTRLNVLDVFKEEGNRFFGEALVSSIVTIFKKMKLDTHENLGFGQVNLPEIEMHTHATWMTIPRNLFAQYTNDLAQGAMLGVRNILRAIAPLYLMCAPFDIAISYRVRDPFTGAPTLYFNDTVTGGLGLSERIFDLFPALMRRGSEVIRECPCEAGCPSCIGPEGALSGGADVKNATAELMENLAVYVESPQ